MSDTRTLNPDVDAHFNEMVNALARQHPCIVLYLEDDEKAAQQVRALFEANPAVEFHHARGPIEASDLLRSSPIDVVVVDINLGVGVPTGEDWILKNRELLKGKVVVVLSGYVGQIQELAMVQRVVAQIVERGEEEHKQLWQFPERLALQRAAEAVQDKAEKMDSDLQDRMRELGITDVAPPRVRPIGGTSSGGDEKLRRAMVSLFRQWAEKIPDQSRGFIYIGDEIFSATDLMREVESGTKTGNTFLRLFTEDLSELI